MNQAFQGSSDERTEINAIERERFVTADSEENRLRGFYLCSDWWLVAPATPNTASSLPYVLALSTSTLRRLARLLDPFPGPPLEVELEHNVLAARLVVGENDLADCAAAIATHCAALLLEEGEH